MKKNYKIRNVLHGKIGYLELEITVKALLWASQIASEGGSAGIIEIWTSEPCRQKKINSNWSELLQVFIFHQYEGENSVSKLIWDKIQKNCCSTVPSPNTTRDHIHFTNNFQLWNTSMMIVHKVRIIRSMTIIRARRKTLTKSLLSRVCWEQ